MQARVILLQINGPQLSIILLIKIDGSSKLRFEEMSNNVIGDKIFKKGSTIDFISCSHGFPRQSALSCIPYEMCQKFHRLSPKFKGKVKIKVY